jgi:Diacylglycerol acyltransferase
MSAKQNVWSCYLLVLVGKPIITEQSDNPEQSVVDTMHQRYMQALSDLFNEHKVKYDIDPGMNLHFI